MVTATPQPSDPDHESSRSSEPGDDAGSHRSGSPDGSGSGPGPGAGSDSSSGSGAGSGAYGGGGWPPPVEGTGAEPPGDLTVRQEVARSLLCLVAVAVLGVLLGLLWLWLAPRIPLFTDGKAVYLKDPEGEESIGADGTFTLLALAVGAVSGVVAFFFSRRGGIGIVLGLLVGALLGSLLAWRLGVWLGPNTDLPAAAKAAGAGKTFDGPLKLQAKGALLAWPLAGLLVHLALLAMFGTPDPAPPAPQAYPGQPYPGGPYPEDSPPGSPGPAGQEASGPGQGRMHPRRQAPQW